MIYLNLGVGFLRKAGAFCDSGDGDGEWTIWRADFCFDGHWWLRLLTDHHPLAGIFSFFRHYFSLLFVICIPRFRVGSFWWLFRFIRFDEVMSREADVAIVPVVEVECKSIRQFFWSVSR